MKAVLCMLLLFACAYFPAPASAEIHQWTDANGRVHFGDRSPGGATVKHMPSPATTRELPLDIRIHDEHGVLDASARAQTSAGIQRIFEVYTGMFRLNMRRPVVVDISLFETHTGMQRWASGLDPSAQLPRGVLGVYLTQYNVIGAWKHSDDINAVIATLLHESSHVIVAQLSPSAPAWLQEGLAQYFEGLDPAADGYIIRPKASASDIIDTWVTRKELVTLQQYFSLDEARWRHLAHARQNPVPYVVAWSVSYFLMSKPVGRQIVGELLQDMEKTRRAPTRDAIEKRYPGGYALMEYEWFKWAQGEKKAQTLSW